jgi:carbon monoxide dehydrogenase subunit G
MELTNEFKVGVPVERTWEVLTDVELIAPCMPGAQLQEIEGEEYRGVVKVKVGPITAQYKGAARFLEKDEAGHKVVLRAEGRETRGQGNANATITATMTPESDGTQVTVVTDLTITGRVAQFGRGVMADVSSKLLGQFVDCLESMLLSDSDSGSSSPTASASPSPSASSSSEPADNPAPQARPTGPFDIASEGAAATRSLEEAGGEAAATGTASAAAPAPATAASSAPATAASSAPATAASGSTQDARLNGTSGPAVRIVDAPEAEPVDLLDAAGAPVVKRLAPAVIGLTVLWLLSIFLRRRRRNR